ncbi:hypothetical protein [Kineosporia succinea]|uniref:Uncharacterized protein n=1 Tax=Kineosporia succinea TaxID=84632 RepID=A0ABT9P9P5_9ACTN|nr:hypothetical protein [Kineosporia succinea]MDP9829423.1 hypothetical protein [Kineosporia succinea]
MTARTEHLLVIARQRREQVEAELSALDAQIDELQGGRPGSFVIDVEKAPPAMEALLADPVGFHRRALAEQGVEV